METAPIKATLEQVFALYTRPLAPAQTGEVLNRVAWIHRAEGWQLLGKPHGNNVPMPDGQLISADFLVHGPTRRGWDVFFNAGGVDSRVLGPEGEGEDLSAALAAGERTLVDPIRPLDLPEEDVPDPLADLDGVRDELRALGLQVHGHVASMLQFQRTVAELETKVQKLEDRPAPAVVLPPLVAEGSTSSAWGHKHSFRVTVKPA